MITKAREIRQGSIRLLVLSASLLFKVGHVLVDVLTDKPWSGYFCCLLASSREFVRKNPVATKRALRAILKANEICAADAERAVRSLVNRGYTRGEGRRSSIDAGAALRTLARLRCSGHGAALRPSFA